MAISDDFVVGRGVEFAETTEPHAILVSHPQHLITPVASGSEVCPGVTRLGIGYMTIGLDLSDRTFQFCELNATGEIVKEGQLKLDRSTLHELSRRPPRL